MFLFKKKPKTTSLEEHYEKQAYMKGKLTSAKRRGAGRSSRVSKDKKGKGFDWRKELKMAAAASKQMGSEFSVKKSTKEWPEGITKYQEFNYNVRRGRKRGESRFSFSVCKKAGKRQDDKVED